MLAYVFMLISKKGYDYRQKLGVAHGVPDHDIK